MSKAKTPQETLWELIKDIRFGMLTHRHPGGMLHAHPLTTLNKSIDEGATLYFFVSRKTELGQRIRQDGSVNVSYAKPENDSYISVSGQARVSEDQATKDRLFNALTRAWFPGGSTDPDLELVEVQIQHAEYWDVKESKVTQLFKMAQSAITGNQPHIGEHKELHFS
jgi:general stress protein 26